MLLWTEYVQIDKMANSVSEEKLGSYDGDDGRDPPMVDSISNCSKGCFER